VRVQYPSSLRIVVDTIDLGSAREKRNLLSRKRRSTFHRFLYLIGVLGIATECVQPFIALTDLYLRVVDDGLRACCPTISTMPPVVSYICIIILIRMIYLFAW